MGKKDKKELNALIASIAADTINKIGKVSFEYEQGVSYLVFENAYNNDLIYELIAIAELDTDKYWQKLSAQDAEILNGVKQDVSEMLRVLASTQLNEQTVPALEDVKDAAADLKAEFEAVIEALDNDVFVDLTQLRIKAYAFRNLFNS
ncbi:MAG TPA: hypothetical protein VIL23_00480 [Clostridia bacterium]